MKEQNEIINKKPVKQGGEWEEIKLNQLFDKVRKCCRDDKKHVVIHDTTGNVNTFYAYNTHSKLLEFHKNIMRVHAKTESKQDAFENLRSAAIYSMKNGTTFVIQTDVFAADFNNEWTDTECFPAAKLFDYDYWRKDKNYMQIVRIEDETDLCGKPCGYFPWNEDFGIAILTTISNPHDMVTLAKNVPHWKDFQKFKVVE